MEKTPPTAENVQPSAAAPAPKPAPVRRLKRRGRIVLASIVVFVGIALATRRPNLLIVSPISATVPAQPAATPAPVADAPASVAPAVEEAPKAAEPAKKATAPAAKDRIAPTTKSSRINTATSVDSASHKEASGAVPAVEPVVAARASAATATVDPNAVTITGCLEMSTSADEFRLSDTEGVDAPKARSWKTGFLKKHSAAVVLVAPPDPHGLQAQVGKRVAATGLLNSHELKVSTLRVVGPCD